MKSLIQRLKNLWAWSYYQPGSVGKWVAISRGEAQDQELSITQLVDQSVQGAQIIYPNKREELLRAKPDLSLDELLSEK